MRRILATIMFAVTLGFGGLAATPAAAQTGEATSTTAPAPGGDIIPQPGSGEEPEDAGDRGGALQTVLFVGLVGGVTIMAWLVVRQSRRVRAERGF